jgi:chromatin structure-remodeling complex subunit RSC1/2
VVTGHFAEHPLEDILEKIACQFTARHIRGRPRPPYWYPGFPLYVCDSRYNDRDRVFVKIKNWNSCIPEEVRQSTEFMPIYPFEKTVFPVRYSSPFLRKTGKTPITGPGGIVEGTDPSESGPTKGVYVGSEAQNITQPAAPPIAAYLQQYIAPAVETPQAPKVAAVDRTVFTAAGGSSLGNNIYLEKLPPETSMC